MKILQNETTNNNSTTTSTTTTPNSKEKHQHHHQQQHPPHSSPLSHFVEKRKAKTLKNKILQNVAQQQQQQEELYQQQQQQQLQQNVSINNNSNNTPSAMTDERTKANKNNSNSNKTNNSTVENKIATTSTSSTSVSNLKDSLKDSSSSSSCSSSNKNNNNNSDLIIAEAAKILLKNGLNGTNAAAAAAVATATATLLTAAANFHNLPTANNTSSSLSGKSNLATSASSPIASDTPALDASNVKTAAAAAHAQLVAIAAAAAAVNATNQKRLAAPPFSSSTSTSCSTSSSSCKSPNQTLNNGLLVNTGGVQATSATSTPPTVGTATATTATHFTKPYKTNSCKNTMSSSMDTGIIDYTINSNSNNNNASLSPSSSSSSVINLSASANNINSSSGSSTSNAGQHKFLNNNHIHSHSNRSDIGRPPISQHHYQHHNQTSNVNNHKNAAVGGVGGFGGRLQFFKDGKFILELARSKDGEKGGWVSVPRKIFRTPSAATSSTVTPSATASTSAATIPSPLNASPAAVVGGGSYPKNECSNSLSFSDDNSSLQSSPWQRDHCWKQAAPRKNVSKELTLFYRRPAYHKLTTQALLLSHRKRRKPHDTKTLENGSIFELKGKKNIQQQTTANDQQQVDKSTLDNKNEVESKEDIEKTNKIDDNKETEDDKQGRDAKSIKSCSTEEVKTEIDDGENKNNGAKEGNDNSSDNKTIIKSEQETLEEIQDVDVEMTKLSSPCKVDDSEKAEIIPIVPNETTKEIDQVEKMNTSDYANEEEANSTTSMNGNILNDVPQQQKEQHLNIAATQQGEKFKTGDEEKRLKKHENYKTRAKLATIVQKLMDASTSRLAATAHQFKTSNQTSALVASFATTPTSMSSSTSSTSSGLTPGGTKNQNSKVSPPSNTAASRLVEYHQQHVSPRKRILREFEKVSLEDSTTGGAAGGKRSRAKGNTTNTPTPANNSNTISSTSSTSSSNKTMNFNTHPNLGNTPKSTASSAPSTAPTKLYSSYSIHSLLGGGLSTSSSSTAQSSASKKSTDLPATITSSSLAYSPYHSASFPSNSHSNNSPKSPEGNNMMGGGKSPSNSATKSKRSPPYSSPMRETHSKSPINSGGNGGYTDYSGRRSPRSTPDTAHNAFNKMRYASNSGIDTTASSTNHHLQHQQQPPHHLQQQQHYHHQPQTYYSPYMMSPHYVPPLSGPSALSPNASSANASTSSSRSPRHHPSAFRATTPTSTSSTSTTHNIPSSQKGDLSPQRSTTASPRETTPRTVPKKTASIRRQFASPTSATQNHNNSNCSSPITTTDSRSDEQMTSERRTPVNSNTSHQQHQQHQQPQHIMQRSSPGNPNLAGSPIHPYSYLYAQPSNSSNSPHTSNAVGSNHPSSAMSPSSANASVAAAAAAAAASYIPAVVGSPYYHPYISTLAAMRHPQMWMQHYQSAAAAAVNPALIQARHPAMLSAAAAAGAAARLSPPYGHSFQYNGVGNAAALAAAAAAAGFGSTATPPHHPSNALTHPSSMFNSMANSSLHGIQHAVPTMQTTAGLVPATAAAAALSAASSMTDTTDSKSSKHNFSSSTSSSSSSAEGVGGGGLTAHGLSPSTGPSGNSMYTISNKDEQSSDVPLNLSKH